MNRHIFTVPETVAKTEVWIEEGKLLQVLPQQQPEKLSRKITSQAHQSLVDLENSRDDLLYELHRLGHNNTRDRWMKTQMMYTKYDTKCSRDLLREYFEAVTELSGKMEKQLGFILLRAFATVRKNPRELVSSSTRPTIPILPQNFRNI